MEEEFKEIPPNLLAAIEKLIDKKVEEKMAAIKNDYQSAIANMMKGGNRTLPFRGASANVASKMEKSFNSEKSDDTPQGNKGRLNNFRNKKEESKKPSSVKPERPSPGGAAERREEMKRK